MESLNRRSPHEAAPPAANKAARDQALQAVVGWENRPAALVSYESQGVVLIVGRSDAALDAAHRLGPNFECLVLVTGSQARESHTWTAGSSRPAIFAGELAALEGYLGRFRVRLKAGEQQIDLLELGVSRRETVDLVLDLADPPWICSQVPPPGYFAPAGNPDALDAALAQIPGLVGHFEKPQFFAYDPNICAHSRSGVQACTRCIDACPANAIRSNGDQGIQVDPHLCQGAGSCASACPSGAIRYHYPALGDSLERIDRVLKVYREAGGEQPILLFYDEEGGADRLAKIADRLPGNVLPLEVAELGSVGMDQWFGAFAFGAARLVLLGSAKMPASVAGELQAQQTVAQALLEGMGYPAGALKVDTGPSDDQLLMDLTRPDLELKIKAGAFACLDDKRGVLRLALDHLFHQAPAPRPLITLPSGAAFGEVSLVEGRCTLCMACVSQCPGKALIEGGDLPQLKFVEDNCIQCAMCARVCPENAIAPSPRYLFDGLERRKVRLLKEEPPFLCVHCGKPFATHSVIRKITQRLTGHPNFGPREMARLEMCEDCRVKSLFAEELSQQTSDLREVGR